MIQLRRQIGCWPEKIVRSARHAAKSGHNLSCFGWRLGSGGHRLARLKKKAANYDPDVVICSERLCAVSN